MDNVEIRNKLRTKRIANVYSRFLKRPLGCGVALILLIIASPLLLVTAFVLACYNGGHVFFRQPRPGKNGKVFRVLKFKTMTDEKDAEGRLLPDSDRLTRFGAFVRSTSIDELPQLWNVLRGDMALIGPRPLLVEYLPLYNERQARRHEVRPGITGWAQVHGRNAISWEEKFELDVWYVDHLTLLTDLRVVKQTIVSVLRRSGISAAGEATMPAFRGTDVTSP